MKRNRKFMKSRILCIMVAFALILSACSSSKTDMNYNSDNSSQIYDIAPEAVTEEARNEMGVKYESSGQADMAEGEMQEGTNTEAPILGENRKLIQRISMSLEALDFDKIISTIQTQVSFLGGYIENSELGGNGYYSGNNTRYSSMIIRIPRAKVSDFVNEVSKDGNVLNKSESLEDVTLQYVDMESHKKSLKIEQDRLFELLEKAEALEDIIAIEARMSEVRYQLEFYESQLRMYDNQIDYTTITLYISEVEKITNVDDKTLLQRMKSGFLDSLYNIKTFITEAAIFIVSNILILIIVVIIIFLILRFIRKRKLISPIKNNRAGKKNKNSNIDKDITDNGKSYQDNRETATENNDSLQDEEEQKK